MIDVRNLAPESDTFRCPVCRRRVRQLVVTAAGRICCPGCLAAASRDAA